MILAWIFALADWFLHVPDSRCLDLIGRTKKWLKVFSTPNYLFACNTKEYWLYMIRCCSCSCKVQTGRWMMVRSSGIMPTPFLFATSWSTTFSQWSLMYILITIFPWNCAGILVLFAGRPSQRHNRSTDPPKTNYGVPRIFSHFFPKGFMSYGIAILISFCLIIWMIGWSSYL
jgi:hypothetical protein